ncbi:WD repeat-containing protein WRAP73 isoform X1 [Synchiropus splendidus]|uniref:WD repeat-containing protein WRAP73 isoform X1 n=1 Tax=Synchiropus splendidus TaxID=270530 RepID=UPI00237E6B13|nr:WD repeat-containing protein WRAP73 isoform X1 [Synchiropus splendidus]XP_053705802.1 WD repeat-containing protein WRAP73 isoform X1 [Synchiropus splendidus]
MNFSEFFKQTNQLCKLSPDGKYLATCVQYRLVVRDLETLQILHLYTCLDQISHMEWSSDSQFILCAMYKRGLVQVWSLEQPDWHCKIDEGSIGLVASRWSPDGRHILNTTEFHLRITVWSLCTKAVSYIKYPKACHKGMDFTRDGSYMALAERRDCKDYVSVFVCDDWHLLRHFETETQDLCGLEWSPNGCVLAVWDSCLEYKVLLYSLDGRLLSTYSAYEWSLGIKSVTWSPSSQFLAIGSYDEKVRILNHVTWKKVTQFDHPANINGCKTVYKELVTPAPVSKELPLRPSAPRCSTLTKYEVCAQPVHISSVKPDPDRANPKIGVSSLAFSCDSHFLATKNVGPSAPPSGHLHRSLQTAPVVSRRLCVGQHSSRGELPGPVFGVALQRRVFGPGGEGAAVSVLPGLPAAAARVKNKFFYECNFVRHILNKEIYFVKALCSSSSTHSSSRQ